MNTPGTMAVMNGAILLGLLVLTATSFSFRYVRWLSALMLVDILHDNGAVTRYQLRHFGVWLLGLLVQLEGMLCYLLCNTDLIICTLSVLAITIGKIHDVALGTRFPGGLSRSPVNGLIPTVPILAIAMPTALYLYTPDDTCEVVTGSAIGVLALGSCGLFALQTQSTDTFQPAAV